MDKDTLIFGSIFVGMLIGLILVIYDANCIYGWILLIVIPLVFGILAWLYLILVSVWEMLSKLISWLFRW